MPHDLRPFVVNPIRPDQREAAAETLSEAFHDDPLLQLLAPDPRRRAAVGRWFFQTSVDYGMRWGRVWVAGDAAAVAIWLPPGTRFGAMRSLRVGMGAFPFRVGLGPMRRILRVAPALQRLHGLVRGPHWYLMTIGTRPSRQGEGLGSAVLAAGTSQADLDGLPCYLETSTQRAVDFYLEHGFDVVGREDLDGHIVFGLVRQAASERNRSAQRGDGSRTWSRSPRPHARNVMKAVVQNAYGSPNDLELEEVDKPVVKQDAVLVRVHPAALNAGDTFTVRGHPWLVRFYVGFPRPKDHILGWDVGGRVEAVGANVKRFQPGDDVFGACSGTLAEYVCATENELAAKPANLSFEQAAAVPTAALTALQGLRDAGKVKVGQRVLINGASGGVGTFAVQIANVLGAEVTGVCSTRNVDLVRSLGADHVIDYTQEDFTRRGAHYDLILDNARNRSFADCRRALAPGGTLLPNTGHAGMGYVIMAFARSVIPS